MPEYFAFPTQAGDVIRLAFPDTLPLEERDAYIAAQVAAHEAAAEPALELLTPDPEE